MLSFRFIPVIYLAVLFSTSASAGVEVEGTRLIYDADKKEAFLPVKNLEKDTSYLIQTWLDNGNENDQSKIPFIITPPLFRLDSGQENQIRVIFSGALPQDRESIYWLSVKSIASTSGSDVNHLQISVRTRIKLIYRPASLKDGASDAYKQLRVTRNGNEVTLTNPTPYYISLHSVYVGKNEIKEAGMVAPRNSHILAVPAGVSGKISWRAINDYGGFTDEITN